MTQNKQLVYLLVGPTAVGKTAVAIEIARKMGAEVVSADSMQIYKELNIASAKPSTEEMQGVPHHMLSVVNAADQSFSVARFVELANECIADILQRGNAPLVVGGTGLYTFALTRPLSFGNVQADETVRERLKLQEIAVPGSLYRRLEEVDAYAAAHIHPNDQKRIIRALEVFELSGKPFSSFGTAFQNDDAQGGPTPYTYIKAGLTMDRQTLYKRIDARVDQMLQVGLIEESRELFDAGLDCKLPAMQSLGCKQLFRYFAGEQSLEEAVEDIRKETRHFAKRQWTWFRRDPDIQWFDCTGRKPEDIAREIITYFQTEGEGKR